MYTVIYTVGNKPVSTDVQTLLNGKQYIITDSTNLVMNNCEVESNLTLIVKTSNNTDLINAILIQNTGTYYNIALTRRYSTVLATDTANFCIQTGFGPSITSLPIRVCVKIMDL